MNVEHLLLAKKLSLAANGGTETLTLESGSPYRHYMAWVVVDAPIPVGALPITPDIDVQPMFGGENDGGVVNIIDNVPTKVIQVPVEQIRPPTILRKHPDDDSAPVALKSELVITNSHLTADAEVSVYMMAAATIGGA